MDQYQEILLTVEDKVATILLNRPDINNLSSTEMKGEVLAETSRILRADLLWASILTRITLQKESG